jgi:hypothetical protein
MTRNTDTHEIIVAAGLSLLIEGIVVALFVGMGIVWIAIYGTM